MAGIGPSCDPRRSTLPHLRCHLPTKLHHRNCEGQLLSALPRALPCKNTARCSSSTTLFRPSRLRRVTKWMFVVVALVLFATLTSCYQCESFNVNSLAEEAGTAARHAVRHGRARHAAHRHRGGLASLAEIIPRMDLVERVSEPMIVSCHYNHTALGDQPVQFARMVDRKMTELPFTRYNESTITAVLHHDRSESYKIFCYAPTYRTKNLCHRQVNVGYPPQDLLDFRCVSPNWWVLNCSWTRPVNFVPTRYTFEYVVPHYKPLNEILVGSDQNSFELEVLTTIGSRETVTIVVTGNNSLGVANFTHDVNVYNVVVPSVPLKLEAYNITTHSARLGWHMHYRMDSMPGGLVHEVAWRVPPALNWNTKSVSASVPNTTVPTHQYEELVELPYAHTLYEVKVRMHTATGALRDEFWSKPAVVTFTTAPKLPDQLAATDVSSFEASNFLESRELFIYWRQLLPLQHNGDGLHYRVTARDQDTGGLVEQMPILSNLTYAKFTDMNSTSSYRFEITAVNTVGAALTSSEVIVPRKAHMPDTPDMFTVIKYKNPKNELSPIYRLLWKSPSNLGDYQQPIVSYTLFWCPVATYDIRCEEDLHWESTGDNLESLRLKKQNAVIWDYSLPVLFEKNMTGLPQNQKFGIAAVSASGASSGIKWSSCSVPYDDSPPAPRKPTAAVDNSRTVKVSWLFDCPDKSAVPLAVKIFYCEIDPGRTRQQDFSDCITPKSFVQDGLRGPSVISGLRPSSTVIFSLSVLSVVGASRHSVPVSVTMPEDVPDGPPMSLRVTRVSNTSVSLQWQPPSADRANGVLTEYEVSTRPPSAARLVSAQDAAKGDVTVRGLSPYTQYTVSVAACTRQGCAVRHPAVVVITTEPGVPATVNMFNLNSIDGKMTWEFDADDCHSASCTFDMDILYNGTVIPLRGLQQNSINLKDLNITCNQSKSLNVSLRAVGVASDGSSLYGPWNSKEGPCTVPVNVVLAWWIVLVVVVVCFLVALVLFVVTKCGFNVFRQITKPIKVPNLTTIDAKTAGLKHQSINSHHPRHLPQPPLSHPHQGRCVLAPLPGPVLISTGIPSKHGGRGAPYGDDNNKKVPLLSQTSRCSETDLVERDADRHGRNLSGDSSRSSGECSSEADSAVASAAEHHDTSSSGSAESDTRFLRQVPEHWPGSNLRQRSPGPYVMHGERPRTNIGEGYVAVRSNSSLMRDLKIPANTSRVTPTISNNGLNIGQHQLSSNNLQRSTPNLPASATGSHPSLTSLRTPATSAGYFSTAESDELLDMRRSRSGGINSTGGGGGYPMKGNMGGIGGSGVNSGTVVVAPPYSTIGSPFPLYSRHSCTPPSANKPSILGGFAVPSNANELKYVAVGYSPPNNNSDQDDRRLGSTEGAFSLKRRPPSMPSLVNLEDMSRKSSLMSDTLESAGAYCVVGNRNGNNTNQPLPSSQGYVTLSNQSRPPTSSSSSIDATINNMNTFGNSILVASPPSSASMSSSRQVIPRTVSEAPSAYLPNGDPNEISPTGINSPINGEKPHPNTTATSNGAVAGGGYVTVGERGFPSSNPSLQDGFRQNPVHPDVAVSNYVTAASMPDRWAFNRSALPKQFDVADEVRHVASAPSENSRGRFHPQKISAEESNFCPPMTERPNTSDGLTNRPKRLSQSPSSSGWPMGGPSLSKQSSGYVSQEALSTDPLVMSPKRLFLDEDSNKSTKSISHEVSFV